MQEQHMMDLNSGAPHAIMRQIVKLVWQFTWKAITVAAFSNVTSVRQHFLQKIVLRNTQRVFMKESGQTANNVENYFPLLIL